MDRQEIVRDIDKLFRTYCDNCELKRQPGFGWPGGCRVIHVCIHDCKIGQKLQKYGDQLKQSSRERKGKSA